MGGRDGGIAANAGRVPPHVHGVPAHDRRDADLQWLQVVRYTAALSVNALGGIAFPRLKARRYEISYS